MPCSRRWPASGSVTSFVPYSTPTTHSAARSSWSVTATAAASTAISTTRCRRWWRGCGGSSMPSSSRGRQCLVRGAWGAGAVPGRARGVPRPLPRAGSEPTDPAPAALPHRRSQRTPSGRLRRRGLSAAGHRPAERTRCGLRRGRVRLGPSSARAARAWRTSSRSSVATRSCSRTRSARRSGPAAGCARRFGTASAKYEQASG
jgi:hypothetical protein